MRDDLISRQAAIDATQGIGRLATLPDNDPVIRMSAVEYVLFNLPSAQPERPKGEWVYGENDGQDGWYCSVCGFFVPWDYEFYGLDNIDFIADYHTCPKCDAKMLRHTGE